MARVQDQDEDKGGGGGGGGGGGVVAKVERRVGEISSVLKRKYGREEGERFAGQLMPTDSCSKVKKILFAGNACCPNGTGDLLPLLFAANDFRTRDKS